MTTESRSVLDEWAESLRALAARHQIVFVQLGATYEPVYPYLATAASRVVDMRGFLKLPEDELMGIIAITGLEGAIASKDDVLGKLRERIAGAAKDGLSTILVSRRPRAAFPDVPGSSLLVDAKFVPGPVSAVTELQPGEPAWNVLPACRENGASFPVLVARCLAEVGSEVCAALDRAFFELMVPESGFADVLTASELEALQGTGLVSIRGGIVKWTVAHTYAETKEALAEALANLVEPPVSLAAAYELIWTLEHIIRRVMRNRAIDIWGARWRRQVLPSPLAVTALEKARMAGYATARSIAELRDPLEWISFGELLEVRQRPDIGDLGMPKVLWTRLTQEVLPIRNNLAHMHLTSREDVLTLRKWTTAISRHIS